MKKFLLMFLFGCGGTYDIQCDGPGSIDCELIGLSICTKTYGDRAPHAFCTKPCRIDSDCGPYGICTYWDFTIGTRQVCVAPYWLNSR
jgi:hypothetical protein